MATSLVPNVESWSARLLTHWTKKVVEAMAGCTEAHFNVEVGKADDAEVPWYNTVLVPHLQTVLGKLALVRDEFSDDGKYVVIVTLAPPKTK